MKNKKVIIIIVVILLIMSAIIGYTVYKKKQRQKMMEGVTKGGTTPISGSSSSGGGVQYSDEFPLKVGSKGNNVIALQYAINEGCPEISTEIGVDGDFGPQTEAAADACLAGQNGHVKGQVSYAEYQWLTKRVSHSEDQKIKEGCTASAASRLYMKTVWGVDCEKYGY